MNWLVVVISIIAVIISGVLILNQDDSDDRPVFEEGNDALLKIDEVEQSLGRLDEYSRSDDMEGTQSLRFSIPKGDRELDLATQIIKHATQEETVGIFNLHVEDLLDEDPYENKDISIGDHGKLIKISMPDEGGLSTFYILYYKDTELVLLTLNFAKDSDEDEFLVMAREIEERLN